jgi:hypothetical protein
VVAWQLDHDVVALGSLRLAVQRIASSHWKPSGELRSWGLAPLHREGDALLVPCAAQETLWLGVWLEDGGSGARVRVTDEVTGMSAAVELPREFRLTALHGPDATDAPLTLPDGGCRRLRLEFDCDTARAAAELVLLTPRAWAARAGREGPAPLDQPPPLPPHLG